MRTHTQPPTSLMPARNWHFQYIAEHMRPDEREHWMALSGASSYDADTAAMGFINAIGLRFALVGRDALPVVAGGMSKLRGNTYEAWMVGTMEGWQANWREITRGVRWVMRQQFKAGAHRIQIVTLESRARACQWYERALGMKQESVLHRAGAQGQNLVMYATFRENWL